MNSAQNTTVFRRFFWGGFSGFPLKKRRFFGDCIGIFRLHGVRSLQKGVSLRFFGVPGGLDWVGVPKRLREGILRVSDGVWHVFRLRLFRDLAAGSAVFLFSGRFSAFCAWGEAGGGGGGLEGLGWGLERAAFSCGAVLLLTRNKDIIVNINTQSIVKTIIDQSSEFGTAVIRRSSYSRDTRNSYT